MLQIYKTSIQQKHQGNTSKQASTHHKCHQKENKKKMRYFRFLQKGLKEIYRNNRHHQSKMFNKRRRELERRMKIND